MLCSLDSDGSAAIELEEIQQMFYVYYGYKGKELDEVAAWIVLLDLRVCCCCRK